MDSVQNLIRQYLKGFPHCNQRFFVTEYQYVVPTTIKNPFVGYTGPFTNNRYAVYRFLWDLELMAPVDMDPTEPASSFYLYLTEEYRQLLDSKDPNNPFRSTFKEMIRWFT